MSAVISQVLLDYRCGATQCSKKLCLFWIIKVPLINTFISTADQMTRCNVKGIVRTDKPSQLSLNSVVLGFVSRSFTVLV